MTPTLSDDAIAHIVNDFVAGLDAEGSSVVVVVPDRTRTAPMAAMTALIEGCLGAVARRIDYLVALGTHPPMTRRALIEHLGPPGRRAVNHAWHDDATFAQVGTITADELAAISDGRLREAVRVRVNRMILDADAVVLCGPVFPHEVVGFSGGNKYLFPGVSGPEMIDISHWLGALITSHDIIGMPGLTPVRRLIDHAASMIPTPRHCLAMVVSPTNRALYGLFAGRPEDAWAQAAAVSATVHVHYVDHPYRTVLSVMPPQYEDLWTAAKGMYKVEPVVADGGEVIVYAPHVTEISRSHGCLLAGIGYHVRDYFVGQLDRFAGVPGRILAHSTHLRGAGTWAAEGGERPRIEVTLATGIDRETCVRHGLGYRDPAGIDVAAWERRAKFDQSLLVVPKAGEILYRLRRDTPTMVSAQ